MSKLKPTATIIAQTATALKLASDVRPKWIETIARDQRLLNSNAYLVGATSGLKALGAVLEIQRFKIDGCISELSTLQKHMLNVTMYNPQIHNASYIKMLSSTAEILSRSTPLTMQVLNISRLGGLERETAAIMKTAKMLTLMPVSSLQLAETLKPIASLSAELQIKADSTLATSQLLKSYSAFVLAQHKSIQRDIDSADKRLKMIEIATDMVQDHISSVCDYVYEENQSVEDTTNSDIQADNSKTAIQYIPSYLGYALKENSTCDLEEEFQKSMICKIITGGKDIAAKIEYINDYYLSNGKKELFTPTNKTFRAISCLSTSFSVDGSTFGNVIDSLYMLLYEGSGEAKRVLEVLSDSECAPLWNIKHIRTDFRHDIEHGDEKKYMKKMQLIGAAYKDICGKNKPLKQKDWVTAHCNLFVKVNEFLDLMIEKIAA